MAKGSLMVGGVAIAVCALGGLAFGADAWIDHKAKEKVEQKLSSATGLEVDCAKADVNLLKQQVTIRDIRFANLNPFPSPHLFKIDSIHVQTEGLNNLPLNIEKMVIQDVEMNLDIQASDQPQSPNKMMQINAQELLQQIEQQEKTLSSSYSTKEPELNIQQMQFNNIQVQTHLQVPLQPNPVTHQFQLQQITLNDVTNENMPEKMSAALQDTILVELQQWMNQQKDQFLSLPKPGGSPSLPAQPAEPLLPKPEGFPRLPQ